MGPSFVKISVDGEEEIVEGNGSMDFIMWTHRDNPILTLDGKRNSVIAWRNSIYSLL